MSRVCPDWQHDVKATANSFDSSKRSSFRSNDTTSPGVWKSPPSRFRAAGKHCVKKNAATSRHRHHRTVPGYPVAVVCRRERERTGDRAQQLCATWSRDQGSIAAAAAAAAKAADITTVRSVSSEPRNGEEVCGQLGSFACFPTGSALSSVGVDGVPTSQAVYDRAPARFQGEKHRRSNAHARTNVCRAHQPGGGKPQRSRSAECRKSSSARGCVWWCVIRGPCTSERVEEKARGRVTECHFAYRCRRSKSNAT